MKKFLLSFAFLVLFGGYAAVQYLSENSPAYSAPITSAAATSTLRQSSGDVASSQFAPPPQTSEDTSDGGSDNTSESAQSSSQTVPIQSQQSQTTQPAQTTTVTQTQGEYIDGTYTGSVANAFYGNVQIEATVSGGKLSNVTFLQYPNDRSTSHFINQQAMPILINEAIQAQGAQVNGVSGASDTSAAFVQSLGSALAQAKA